VDSAIAQGFRIHCRMYGDPHGLFLVRKNRKASSWMDQMDFMLVFNCCFSTPQMPMEKERNNLREPRPSGFRKKPPNEMHSIASTLTFYWWGRWVSFCEPVADWPEPFLSLFFHCPSQISRIFLATRRYKRSTLFSILNNYSPGKIFLDWGLSLCLTGKEFHEGDKRDS
jgi:hypothetical protein